MSLDDNQTNETLVPTGVPAVPPTKRAPRGELWTPTEDKLLRSMRLAGVSYRKIAERLGKTRNGCIGRGNRIGLPRLVDRKPVTTNQQCVARARKRAAGKVWPEPKPSPEPLRDTNLDSIARVSFHELECHHCRWPVDTTQGVGYCGLDAVPGMSWCEAHASRVFVPVNLQPPTAPKPRPAHTHPMSLATLARIMNE